MEITDAEICPGGDGYQIEEGPGSGHSHCLLSQLFSIQDPITQECSCCPTE